MRAAGIICEFNPFHKGHKYLIDCAHNDGYDTVICLMSGNFTQRGEPAVLSKYARAEIAVHQGADIVIELPFPYAASSAEYFAGCGVGLFDALGIDALYFGSECGDISLINHAASVIASPEYKALLKGSRTAAAEGAHQAYTKLTGEAMPSGSNDLLAIMYAASAQRLNSSIELKTVRRQGAGYNESTISDGEIPSATAIRQLIHDGKDASSHMIGYDIFAREASLGQAPASSQAAELAILSFFRLTSPKKLSGIADVSGGLAERLCSSAKRATDLNSFLELSASKNYTNGRIRRAILFCMTSVSSADLTATPAYLNLLATSISGRSFLKMLSKSSPIPILTKPASVSKLGKSATRQAELSAMADSLYTLMLPSPASADKYMRHTPYIEKAKK